MDSNAPELMQHISGVVPGHVLNVMQMIQLDTHSVRPTPTGFLLQRTYFKPDKQ